jgi:hypothetical protein
LVSPHILKFLGIDKSSITDPFRAIDLTLKYVDHLKTKYPKSTDEEIFSIYLYGNSKKNNLEKYRKLLEKTIQKYSVDLDSFSINYRAQAVIGSLTVDATKHIRKTKEEYERLARPEQIQLIKFFVEDFARKLDLDPDTMFKIIEIESTYNHLAISPAKAMGLMQVQEVNLTELKKHIDFRDVLGFIPEAKDLYNPYTNMVVGMYSFRYLLEKYDWNYEKALMIYNIGVGNYAKMLSGDKKQKDAALRYVNKMRRLKERDKAKKENK